MGNRKKDRVSDHAQKARDAIGKNLKRIIAAKYPELSATEAYRTVGAQAGGIVLSTMQALVAGARSAEVDTLANLADALGCELSDLWSPPPPIDRRRRPQSRAGTSSN
jgi:hypothetical protein